MGVTRHNLIIFKPILITNENIKFPECHKCSSEKSPFLLEDGYEIEIFKERLKTLSQDDFLDSIWERDGGGIIIFLCKKCMPPLKEWSPSLK